MPEPIDWLPDGAPFSPRFGDRYHSSANHGVDQARDAFLGGCGLPAAWAGHAQWRILETGFGLGLNFLVTWAAWRADPARPRVLHFVSCEAWPVAAADPTKVARQGSGGSTAASSTTTESTDASGAPQRVKRQQPSRQTRANRKQARPRPSGEPTKE